MSTNFPTSLDSFTAKIDNFDEVMAADVNNLQDAVAAVETELGTLPKGNYASVSSRLAILGEVIGGVTKTVGVGKDFTTIQAAIDWFKGKILKGENFISVDPGTYNENLVIDDYYSSKSTNLQIVGDTRECAGAYFAHQCPLNGGGNRGSGICTLSAAGNVLTVVGATTNPNFATMGVVAGDKIISLDSSGVYSEKTVSSVSGNTITLSTAAPVVSADGSGFIILPNRRIVSPSLPSIGEVYINAVKATITGFAVQSPVTYSSSCIYINNGATITLSKITTLGGSGGGLYVSSASLVFAQLFSDASYDDTTNYRSGIKGSRGSNIDARYSFTMGNNGNHRGFTAQAGCSVLDVRYSIALSLGEGFGTYDGSQYLDAHYTYARKINTTAYNSSQFSYIGAYGTLATTTVVGAGVKHNPATSGTFNTTAATCLFS